MGLAASEKRGQAVEVKAHTDVPMYRPLVELLRLTYGPSAVVPNVLAGIPGIDEVYIYGSWAARREGEPGSPPGDIDVLIVGNPPRAEIHDAAQRAGVALAREVNARIVDESRWSKGDDPFVRTLKQRPLVKLELGDTGQ